MDANIKYRHHDLVDNCRKGDTRSQYDLYTLYVDAMYNTGMRMLRNKEDAEDVVQDSFVAAFNGLDGFKFESSFGAWLKRIVVNKCITHLKKKRELPIPYNDLDHNIIEVEHPHSDVAVEITKVKKGIEKLPNGYRQVINLYLIEGYDHNEIGEILAISASTSKSQYHRAKKKLLDIINTL